MFLSTLQSRALVGIHAPSVTVEAHISAGLPKFMIVGMPEIAVKESKDRVRSALITSGFKFPSGRITVNLGPADLPKESGRYDLPIALSILAASGQMTSDGLEGYEFAGELMLSGALQAVSGMLPFALQTLKSGRKLIIPFGNAEEALLAGSVLNVYAAENLKAVHAHFQQIQPLSRYEKTVFLSSPVLKEAENSPDFSDVRGQMHAKRALEIAASGGHSVLMTGPPGTGKSMLSTRLISILPDLSDDEALESAALLSVSLHGFQASRWKKRPFRSPHHTVSTVAMVGGGRPPRPGEISLAHHGILFLDELPEFHRSGIEALREPLESGSITISRAARQAEFPARFQLICAMNPCPCGYLTDPDRQCRCTKEQWMRYQNRLSGPFLDRIDLHFCVPSLPQGLLTAEEDKDEKKAEPSAVIKKRVEKARQKQWERQACLNAHLHGKKLEAYAALDVPLRKFLEQAMQKLYLSARGYHRVLRVARTIADSLDKESLTLEDITEALSYRRQTPSSV